MSERARPRDFTSPSLSARLNSAYHMPSIADNINHFTAKKAKSTFSDVFHNCQIIIISIIITAVQSRYLAAIKLRVKPFVCVFNIINFTVCLLTPPPHKA